MTVTVYSKPDCVQCVYTAKQLDKLVEQGIINGYNKIDVTEDADARKLLEDKGLIPGQMPVVNAGDDWWSGFRIDHIRKIAA